ncbi:hypothetical protein O59_003773 [Cellvibrio sp. BR]|nr:hypothetical protein O59_003773 [Cellvibrio sp. BR]
MRLILLSCIVITQFRYLLNPIKFTAGRKIKMTAHEFSKLD